MNHVSKISSTGGKRRLPRPCHGIDINYCRNPQCDLFAVPPDPIDRRGRSSKQVKPNQPHGRVIGSEHDQSFVCGDCGQASVLKNNRAVVLEYRRLRGRFRAERAKDSCGTPDCRNLGRSCAERPELYRRAGKTAQGAQRWKCKSCLTTFSVGTSIRRQKRSRANNDILWMITNGLPISKICDFTRLAPRDIYAKIDFIYRRVIDFTARREGRFEAVNWQAVGRRFAADSQTLFLNWPNKRTRAQIAVQHLCTAHANSGYIMAAHLALDPDACLPDIEAEMTAAGDFSCARAFRNQARIWSHTEFADHVDKISRNVVVHPLEAPDIDAGLQLPHNGGLIRQDILQAAHAFYLRACLGKSDDRFMFVLDGDPGLALAFLSAFAPWIKKARADVLVVAFDKHQSNDARNRLVVDGKIALQAVTGVPTKQWSGLTAEQANNLTDLAIERLLRGRPIAAPFAWPFHTKSEPHRQVRILTDRATMPADRRARLMRLATLRAVDAYFHKVRSNLRFAARPAHTPSGNGRAWDRHYLYNPETMVKVVEIYRFSHNWMGSNATRVTPAMRLGLAKGKIYPRDLFA